MGLCGNSSRKTRDTSAAMVDQWRFSPDLPSISSSDINSDYEGYSLGPRFSYTLGINFDYQLSEESGIFWDTETKLKWNLRMQLGYCYPTLYVLNNIFSGSVIYVLIGINRTRKVSKREF